ADDDDAKARRQLCRARLRQRPAARAHQQARALVVRDDVERKAIESFCQHVGLHHHAGAAAGRRVVHGAVLVGGVRADVMGVERPDAGGQRLAGEADAERTGKHCRKDRQDARAPHDGYSLAAGGTTTTIRPAFKSTVGTVASVNGSSSGSAPPAGAISGRRSRGTNRSVLRNFSAASRSPTPLSRATRKSLAGRAASISKCRAPSSVSSGPYCATAIG